MKATWRSALIAAIYSAIVFGGLNLTGKPGILNTISGIAWLLGGSGLICYLPIVRQVPEPPFWLMAFPVLAGIFISTLVLLLLEERLPKKTAWSRINRAVLAIAMFNMVLFFAGWLFVRADAPKEAAPIHRMPY